MPAPSGTDPQTLLSEAAHWLMRLHYDQPSETDRQAFQHWHGQSSAHAAAWQRAQQVMQTFAPLQGEAGQPGQQALKALAEDAQRPSRRRTLRTLGILLMAAPTGWLAWHLMPWRQWTADIATATGERSTEQLPDGTQLVLNTDTAIHIAFSTTERRLRLLAGEVLITTRPDPMAAAHNGTNATPARPFIVETTQGTVQALGTRFSVRTVNDTTTRVAVLEHTVRIQPRDGIATLLQAGEQADFDQHRIHATTAADSNSLLWQNGMLLAKDMRLDAVIAEMARYRPGVLQCDPAIGHLRISGSISLDDTDAGLALLERSLPVRIASRTRYWVTVVPR